MTEPVPYQGMSANVLARLLALVVAYDRKFSLEEVDVAVYHRVAVDYRWTAHEVERAIHKWGATEAAQGFMSPAKLNDLIRVARNDALMRAPVATAYGDTFTQETTRQRIMALYQQEARKSKAESARRKALVMKHEDLRAALLASPLDFVRPEQWTGWVPPATVPSDGAGADGAGTEAGRGYKPNTSPLRAALVAIVNEAERREAS